MKFRDFVDGVKVVGILACVALSAAAVAMIHNATTVVPPKIPGASELEQSTIVAKGFDVGRQLRDFERASFAESRYAMFARFERTGDWDEAMEWWSNADRARRDDPVTRIMIPAIERDVPLGPGAPTAAQIRRRAIYGKGLARGEGS